MRRTSQLVGLDFSTGRSISPLPVMASVAKARLIFMTFRERVPGAPLASLGSWQSLHAPPCELKDATTIFVVKMRLSQTSHLRFIDWRF